MGEKTFELELQQLLNRYSLENESDTPDFILAQFVRRCLTAFAEATKRRESWYRVQSEGITVLERCPEQHAGFRCAGALGHAGDHYFRWPT